MMEDAGTQTVDLDSAANPSMIKVISDDHATRTPWCDISVGDSDGEFSNDLGFGVGDRRLAAEASLRSNEFGSMHFSVGRGRFWC